MRSWKFWSLGIALLLAACGGGSNSGSTPPTPTPVAYTAQLVFKGPLAGSQSGVSTLSVGRSIQSMNQSGIMSAPGATPVPVMIVSPISTTGALDNFSGFGGTVNVVVSPEPSASPGVAIAATSALVALSSPPPAAPTPAPGSGIIAAEDVGSTTGSAAVNVQAASAVNATIASPVSQTATTNVYDYQALALECNQQYLDPGAFPAYAWNGTAWVGQSTIAGADIYLSGPYCTIPGFATSETNSTLHFPAGGTVFSTDTPFSSLAATQWVSMESSATLLSLITQNPDGSSNSELVFKTASGAVVKMFPNMITRGGNPGYVGAIEVSGSSIDGF